MVWFVDLANRSAAKLRASGSFAHSSHTFGGQLQETLLPLRLLSVAMAFVPKRLAGRPCLW